MIQIFELHSAGNRPRSIAARLGISQRAVRCHLDPQLRETYKARYSAHKGEYKEYYKRRSEKIKLEVLEHYGKGQVACVRCGETRYPCLSIDHIDGRGREHKDSIGRRGNGFYRWLVDQGFPLGYQTLCMNCQFLKKWENREWRGGNKPKEETKEETDD